MHGSVTSPIRKENKQMALVRSYVGEYWGRPVYEWIDTDAEENERLLHEEMVATIEDAVGETCVLDGETCEILGIVADKYVKVKSVVADENGVWEELYDIAEVYEVIGE